jgi:hypothetical protein
LRASFGNLFIVAAKDENRVGFLKLMVHPVIVPDFLG